MVRWGELDVFVCEKKKHGEPPFLLAFCRFLDMCKQCVKFPRKFMINYVTILRRRTWGLLSKKQ